jgi:hypothetical protein
MKLLLLSLLLSLACFAQDAPIQPQYWVGGGATYNRAAAPPTGAGWLSFGAHVADRTYSFSTLDMTATTSSIRTGVARILTQSGSFTLMALGDAGVTTIAGVALGSFSGGGLVLYDLGSVSKKLAGVQAVAVVRVVGVTATSVNPIFEIGFGKAF